MMAVNLKWAWKGPVNMFIHSDEETVERRSTAPFSARAVHGCDVSIHSVDVPSLVHWTSAGGKMNRRRNSFWLLSAPPDGADRPHGNQLCSVRLEKKTKLNFWAGPQLRLGAIKALEEVNFYFQPPQLKGTLIGPLIFA
jgi:hypothetical protein